VLINLININKFKSVFVISSFSISIMGKIRQKCRFMYIVNLQIWYLNNSTKN
jgi:hypothetical protein